MNQDNRFLDILWDVGFPLFLTFVGCVDTWLGVTQNSLFFTWAGGFILCGAMISWIKLLKEKFKSD